MNNSIRNEYIQNLINEKDALQKKVNEMRDENIKDIVGEEVNKKLQKLISESEDDDSYTEEEIEEPSVTDDDTDGKADDNSETETDDTDNDSEDVPAEVSDVDNDDVEDDEKSDDDEVWNELEQYRDADGEFDLRGMDKDSVVKVLKLISQDDVNGVRVYKNTDDDTIVLNDDDTDKQYIINLDDSDDADVDVDVNDTDNDDMDESCIEFEVNLNEDLGYTTDYQKETAMDVPSNDEPADSSETYSMDDGVPTGTEKPYGHGSQNMQPYDVNENELEIELDDENSNEDDDAVEEATNVGGFATQNSTTKSHVPSSDGRMARNQSKEGVYSGTQKPRYTNEQIVRIMKKADQIFNENKQLKNIVSELKNQINEAIVINYNMGRVIKLVTENSTSKEEKLDIIKRFDNVRTLQEAKDTFNMVEAELKNPNRIAKINNMIDKQLSENKNRENIVETQIYQSDDLKDTLSFMARMDAIK